MSNAKQTPEGYWLPSDAERTRGYVRPLRLRYKHAHGCGEESGMPVGDAVAFARDPSAFDAVVCHGCGGPHPVAEFVWIAGDGTVTDEALGSAPRDA